MQKHNKEIDISWNDIAIKVNALDGETVRQLLKRYRKQNGLLNSTNTQEVKQIHKELGDVDLTKNYKTTIEIGKDGSQTSDKLISMSEENCKDVDFLLKAHGYSCSAWELISARNNIWNAFSKETGILTLYSSKIVVKPKIQEFDIEWVKDTFKELNNSYKSPFIENKFKNKIGNKMLEINLVDVHFNKLACVDETGNEYNFEIAKDRFIGVIHDFVNRTKNLKFEKILFSVGQDLCNVDGLANTTTKGTKQDIQLKYSQMYKKCLETLVYSIDYLKEFAPVEVFYVKGNHDALTSWTLAVALEQRYNNDENVTVDSRAIPRKYFKFGNVALGFSHGSEEGNRVSNVMQVDVPEIWGSTKYREMHISHLHKEMLTDEKNGLIVRRISTICGSDYWTYDSGYIGAVKKAQAFVWDKETGLTDILNSVII